MARVRTRCYVHDSKPPFQRIAGPIFVNSPSRIWGLSSPTEATIIVSGADINEEWIRPGMCWAIDDSPLGEPIWAGFVAPQIIPLFGDSLTIELIGPKRAMLEIEFAIRLPIHSTKAFAARQAMEAAQLRHGGMLPGDIDATEGAAISIDVRGETISAFINTLHDETGLAEWRERTEFLGGEQLVFYLDFGKLQKKTDIVIGKRDLVDGLFVRDRVPASLTLMGSSHGFRQRQAASVSLDSGTSSGEPSDGTLSDLDGKTRSRILERNIGPGAAKHVTKISERIGDLVDRPLSEADSRVGQLTADVSSVAVPVSADLAELARQRHLVQLQNMDEVMLQVDMTRTRAQAIRLGDVFHLDVPDWGAPLNFEVDVNLHLVQMEIDSTAGIRTMMCRVVE